MRKEVFLVFALLLVIFNIAVVEASLGLSPAKIDFNFVPGIEQTFKFKVLTDDPNKKIEVYTSGELAEYVTLSTEELIGPGSFNATLKLPDSLEKYGNNNIVIGVIEELKEDQFLGSRVEIKGQINVFVPYPGRFAEATLKIEDVNEDEEIPLEIHVINRGREALKTAVSADFFKKDTDKVIERVEFSPVVIDVAGNRYFRKLVDPSKFKAGEYGVFVDVDYSPGSAQVNSTFRVGSLFVDIINFTSIISRSEEPQKFFLFIESKWNSDIDSIFADVSLAGKRNYTTFRTPPVDLEAWQTKKIEGFVETAGLATGNYDVDVVLKYKDQETLKSGKLKIVSPEEKTPIQTIIIMALSAVIAAIIIVSVIVILYLKRGSRKIGKKR